MYRVDDGSVQIAQTNGNRQKRFEFRDRPVSNRQVMQVLTDACSAVSLGNIGRDGDGGPPQLKSQGEFFTPRKPI